MRSHTVAVRLEAIAIGMEACLMGPHMGPYRVLMGPHILVLKPSFFQVTLKRTWKVVQHRIFEASNVPRQNRSVHSKPFEAAGHCYYIGYCIGLFLFLLVTSCPEASRSVSWPLLPSRVSSLAAPFARSSGCASDVDGWVVCCADDRWVEKIRSCGEEESNKTCLRFGVP